ncbi:hypothetical protein [Aurantiacibacter marinus]|uniref:Lipoprotein n=1 Tax=Aurantiacibacter marinus TaxID=874156 RepID=A0A0H0XWQ7_9SPHN|nr:hypothetical protein [Aurantiacibacter marinus]KLI64755.1 hypothetical protein AAV99_04310 [Aurantiacibacter marinus]
MQRAVLLFAPFSALGVGGCVAGTLVDVAAAPVRAAGQVADWATTSQDESDRARGREIRQREERLGELQRDYAELEDRCLAGDDHACQQAVIIRREMNEIIPTIPVERERGD